MSEFQYYEFQTVDRPLDEKQQEELRKLSSRAEITPTRFVNVYSYGDFRGNPRKLMEGYFDVFVYVANWATHRLIFRLPKSLLDVEVVQPYATDQTMNVWQAGDHVLLEYMGNDEGGGGWVTEEEGAAWVQALLPIRDDLMFGDLRSLYLGWLAGIVNGDVEEVEVEPPVPPGLATLSKPLQMLARFLYVDDALLDAAAEASAAAAPAGPTDADLARWVKALPAAEKDDLLLRLTSGEAHLGRILQQQFRQELAARPRTKRKEQAPAARRTAGELLAARDEAFERRKKAEAERAARERERKQREEAEQRGRRLDTLMGKEEQLWREANSAIVLGQAKKYDHAVSLLRDLRDLAEKGKQLEAFHTRLGKLRKKYAGRRTFIQRLDAAALKV